MGTGTKLINEIIREAINAQKASDRERTRQARDYLRLEKERESDRLYYEKEELKFQKQIEKERLNANKEKLKNDLENEKLSFENRQSERRAIRMNYINRLKIWD